MTQGAVFISTKGPAGDRRWVIYAKIAIQTGY